MSGLVNAETGVLIATMTPDEAREVTDGIRTAMGVTWELVVDAYQRRAWAAMGYPSWDAYAEAEFGGSRLRLPREEREQVVASLRESGMSIRAIAAATGIGRGTIERDLAGVPNGTPEDPPDGVEPGSSSPGSADGADREGTPPPPPPDPDPAPEQETTVTGTDGKTYPARKPNPQPNLQPKARRSSLVDTAERAGWEFRKSVERIERIAADDRFPTNREQVAAVLRGHLAYAAEVCQDLLDGFDTSPQED